MIAAGSLALQADQLKYACHPGPLLATQSSPKGAHNKQRQVLCIDCCTKAPVTSYSDMRVTLFASFKGCGSHL